MSNSNGNGQNGKDSKGRFVKGHTYSRGNNRAKKKAREWQEHLYDASTPAQMKQCCKNLFEAACKDKEEWAIKYLIDRFLGKPVESIKMEHMVDHEGPLTEEDIQDISRTVFGLPTRFQSTEMPPNPGSNGN